MFSIIWVVDASLIMSERPALRARRHHAPDPTAGGQTARWVLGLIARLAIVAISLYVTAPFIEKLVRADDIAAWHQSQVETYFQQRDATIQAQVGARSAKLDAGLEGRIASLKQEIDRLAASLASEQERRGRIETEYAPQIAILTRDLAEARARVGDEVLGRDGRPSGYGPEARKWDARAELIGAELAEVTAERDARLSDVEGRIADLQQRLAERSEALQQASLEQQRLVTRITDEVVAEQPPPAPPKLSFAARSKALSALRSSPEEAGVPHFETVEGFAQAALGILFLALIALKLFEPPAVQAYYSDLVQFQYRRYLRGGLADVPGFDHHDDPARRLSPVEFHRLWQRYERDPDGYSEHLRTKVEAESRVRRLLADQAYELALLGRRRDDIDQQLALERRSRGIEEARALLDDERAELGRLRSSLSEHRVHLADRKGRVTEAERGISHLRDRSRTLEERIERLQQQKDAAMAQQEAAKGPLWGAAASVRRAARDLEHRLRELGKEQRSAEQQADVLRAEKRRLEAECDGLVHAVTDLEQEIADGERRVADYRRRLDTLLLTRD
jgi:hypothetical protein